jgi:hypothetical protein
MRGAEANVKMINLLLVLCVALSCGPSQGGTTTGTRQAGIAASEQSTPDTPRNREIAVAVGPLEFFGSWKGSYVKLAKWKDTSDPNIPHPAVFDVLCTIENKADSVIQEGDLVVLTTVDFIVAPTYAYSGDVNKVIEDHNWGRVASMDDVRLERVPFLRPHDHAQLKLKGFDLGRVVKEFNGKDDMLWPWALRLNVRVLNREMTPVALGRIILPVFPADNRLAGK